MLSAGSTSSSGTGSRSPYRSSNSPRRLPASAASASTVAVYLRKTSYCPLRVACWSRNTVSGLNRCTSPSRRHWYSPPTSSRRWVRSAGLAGYARACRAATSAAISSRPIPPIRLLVPVKCRSTSSPSSPIASKTWAPQYEDTVEMPIFDMIFRTPLDSALT